MVRMLVDFYGKTPDLVSVEELQDYLLHRRNVDKWSAATLRISYSALKFFFEKVLHREWHIFGYLKAERPKTLPAVLSKEEIAKLLVKVRTPHNHAYLLTVYSCGLRLQEALNLEVSDIDSEPDAHSHPSRQGGQGPHGAAPRLNLGRAAHPLEITPPSQIHLSGNRERSVNSCGFTHGDKQRPRRHEGCRT
jgi:integrase